MCAINSINGPGHAPACWSSLSITLEAPISGMSMNPERAAWLHAVPARHWADLLELVSTAPVIGMLSAAEVHLRVRRAPQVGCAKLHQENSNAAFFVASPQPNFRSFSLACSRTSGFGSDLQASSRVHSSSKTR